LSGLPAGASWSEYVEWWRTLLQKYLDLEGAKALMAESPEQAVKTAISETLTALSILDRIDSKVSLSHFVQTLRRWLERKSVPISDRNLDGVTVLDAMAARGSRFRTIFVLGLNEGLFPRTIREDAFLRDRTRRLMETVLGSKVAEELAIRLSLEGEDPESLLNNFPSTKALYRPGSQLLDFLEDANGKLSPYDGVIGHLPEYWRDLCQHGVSPTALERYARCPFQFF